MNTDKVLEKIKKCLRLAKSTNSNEAATALRHAQSLMKKYNINQQKIDLSDINSAISSAGKARNPPYFHQILVQTICNAFGVEAIYEYDFPGTKMNVKYFGIDTQPEIAVFAYVVLYRQLKKDRSEYLKTLKRYKRANKTRKADLFAEAWVFVIWNKVKKLAQSKEQAALIKKYKENMYQNSTTLKPRNYQLKANDYDAFHAGSKAGRKARLNHPMTSAGQKRRIGGVL